jgi:F0F1-type ATP synthase epsilon subunit
MCRTESPNSNQVLGQFGVNPQHGTAITTLVYGNVYY